MVASGGSAIFAPFDVGVGEYWRELGFPYPDGFSKCGFDTFAVKATIEFHRSTRYDDVLDVLVRTARLGRTSMALSLEIHRGDEHLISGELIYVAANKDTREPTQIPEAFRAAIAAFERVAPNS